MVRLPRLAIDSLSLKNGMISVYDNSRKLSEPTMIARTISHIPTETAGISTKYSEPL